MNTSRRLHSALWMLVAFFCATPPVAAADLQPATIAAFDRYVRLTELRQARELSGKAPFLWIDRLQASARADADKRLRAGEIVLSALETKENGKTVDIPDGLRHHWIGTVLLEGVPNGRVVALMQDYDRYQNIYAPNVRRSKLVARDNDHFSAQLQLFMKKVVSVVLNTDYEVEYVRINPNRIFVRSYATRIAEVEQTDAGEREKPVGHDNGFLWRFNNYCAVESRDGRTYAQCESVSLSRDIPFGFGWLVRPLVTEIPKESLEFTLNAMRAALTGPR